MFSRCSYNSHNSWLVDDAFYNCYFQKHLVGRSRACWLEFYKVMVWDHYKYLRVIISLYLDLVASMMIVNLFRGQASYNAAANPSINWLVSQLQLCLIASSISFFKLNLQSDMFAVHNFAVCYMILIYVAIVSFSPCQGLTLLNHKLEYCINPLYLLLKLILRLAG